MLVSFLIGLSTWAGLHLCILPGFIIHGLFMLAIPLVALGRLPATGALIQSWHALKSQWLTAAVFHWALIIIAASGLLFCCVGVLATGPLYCAFGHDPLPQVLRLGRDTDREKALRPVPRGLIFRATAPRGFAAGDASV